MAASLKFTSQFLQRFKRNLLTCSTNNLFIVCNLHYNLHSSNVLTNLTEILPYLYSIILPVKPFCAATISGVKPNLSITSTTVLFSSRMLRTFSNSCLETALCSSAPDGGSFAVQTVIGSLHPPPCPPFPSSITLSLHKY